MLVERIDEDWALRSRPPFQKCKSSWKGRDGAAKSGEFYAFVEAVHGMIKSVGCCGCATYSGKRLGGRAPVCKCVPH